MARRSGGMESIERCDPVSYSVRDLMRFTDGFSEENFIGDTQFGIMYRGKIRPGSNQAEDKEVVVKLWAGGEEEDCDTDDQKQRWEDEICFLQHPSVNNHPNLVRLIGYFTKETRFGVVYDLNPIDTLQNLTVKDTFSWTQRIKVAIALTRLLDYLHSCEPPYKVCNLAAAHILIDQDFNPILVEFGMLSGGILGDRPNRPGRILFGAFGYIDRQFGGTGLDLPGKRDVGAYGNLLLNLIAKRVVDKEKPQGPWIDDWAKSQYRQHGVCSLVHRSLQLESAYDPNVGYGITMLAMRCVDFKQYRRPTMKEAVQFIQDLVAAFSHGERQLGLN